MFEYGWNFTVFTESLCPLKVCLRLPQFKSNSFAVWSIDADTMKSPSGRSMLVVTLTPSTFPPWSNTWIMIGYIPDWLNVIREGVRASRIYEVPHFDLGVTAARCQVRSFRVETDAWHPVLVTLATQNELTLRQAPDLIGRKWSNIYHSGRSYLPREVIRSSRADGSRRVHRDGGDGHHMSFEGLLQHCISVLVSVEV